MFPRLAPRAHRATELAKELARQGNDVTLAAILGTYDYTQFQEETGIKVRTIGIGSFDWNTSDKEKRHIALWKKGMVYLFDRYMEFMNYSLARRVYKFLKWDEGYNRIITVANPYGIHWGMAYAKTHCPHLRDVIWVSDCGDPYMGNPFSHHPFYFKYVEKWWCRHTDYITVPTEIAKEGYYPEFRDKIHVIPQGFQFDDSLLAEYKKNEVPTFAYAGTVYPEKRDPRKFLDYLCTLDYDFKFYVFTNKPAMFNEYKDRLGDRLIMDGYIPRNTLLNTLSKMDFVINIRNASAVQAPSKLIDYYLSHRPILEIASDFQESAVYDAFVKGDYAGQVVIPNPEQYNIVNVARNFLSLK